MTLPSSTAKMKLLNLEGDQMTEAVTSDELVVDAALVVTPIHFVCPYCGAGWLRGGHKEGFVKAGAFRHVSGCRAVVMFDMGFVPDRWADGNQLAVPATTAHPNVVKGIKRIKRARSRAGLFPARPV